MRVLYFSQDYTPHDHRFLKGLAATEHSIAYLRLENQGQALEDRPVPASVEIIPWAGGQGPFQLRDAPRLLYSLMQVIQSYQPNLIQAGPIQKGAFLAALAGFHPLVSTSWGYDLLIDAERDSLWRWATSYTLKHSDVMIGDCQTVREKAIEYGMKPENIITFPWGVSLDHFRPAATSNLRTRQGWTEHEFVLISTRGWAPIYGIAEIAKAFTAAAQQLPELRLLMLGTGPQSGLVRSIFAQGGVMDKVFFCGQVPYKELPYYYQAADLYLSASHTDGSSISLLEAMACGIPALVSDIPGNREWVEPDHQGWWFKVGQTENLTQAILNARKNRNKLSEMGQQARLTAEAHADWNQNFPNLLKAYQKAYQTN